MLRGGTLGSDPKTLKERISNHMRPVILSDPAPSFSLASATDITFIKAVSDAEHFSERTGYYAILPWLQLHVRTGYQYRNNSVLPGSKATGNNFCYTLDRFFFLRMY
jgi:hypothetical protein